MRGRLVGASVGALALLGALSGCQFMGAASLTLPFTQGTGSDSYVITVYLAQASSIAPNSEVKVGDVTVGTVREIQFDNWRAKLTVGLDHSVRLPANTTAEIGQKSLLGAEYLDLAPPSAGTSATGVLHDGDVIPLARTGTYPSTEDVLSALAVVLNGGGLNQLRTITTEVNDTLSGRTEDVRDLLTNLNQFVGGLNDQRHQIVAAIDSLNTFSGTVAQQDQTLANAIDQIPPGLAALNADRPSLTTALTALANLSGTATAVINSTQNELLANLRDLQPVLGKLADSGSNLVDSVSELVGFPFPENTSLKAFHGDYANLDVTLDLTLPELQQNLLTGIPVLGGLPPLGTLPDQPNTNPLTVPLLSPNSSTTPTSSGPSPTMLPSTSSPSASPGTGSAAGGAGGSSGNGNWLGSLLGSLTGGGH